MQRNGKRAKVTTVVTKSVASKPKTFRSKAAARPVKGAIPKSTGPELKFVDVAQANYVADTTGTVTLLNGTATGDDYNTRDGRQIVIKSVQIRGRVNPVDGTTSPCHARVLLVWDNATSGVAPTIADILSAATSNSYPLVNNQTRFTILRDMSFFVGGIDTGVGQQYAMSPTGAVVEAYLKINQVTQYMSTTAAVASVQNGGLFMVTIGDQAANAGALFVLATRVRFTDV